MTQPLPLMNRKTVLIVDDEPAIRDMLKVALEMADFQCIEAKNCLLYTSPSPRDQRGSRMPSSA